MSNGKSISFGLNVRFNRAVTAALTDLNVDPMRVIALYDEDTEYFILTLKIPRPLIDKTLDHIPGAKS